MFLYQGTVNTTFQNNIKMPYISIERIVQLLLCGFTAVYSLWSFSSWQLQNCSVGHNEMCTGKITVLGTVIKLLDDICETAVQLSVHSLYIDMVGTAVCVMAKT
jgi:hypothetical protein